MSRKVVVSALAIVSLQVAGVAVMRGTLADSVFTNSLQIISSIFAAAICFGASHRARGLSKPFWLLIGCAVLAWGAANSYWMYYEVILRVEPPTGSLARFLFDIQAIFMTMALLLDQEKDSDKFTLESVLDFTQIAIVFFFIYLGLYYLPSLHSDTPSAMMRELWVEGSENGALFALALFQCFRARTKENRKLYGGFALYLFFFTIAGLLADYQMNINGTPTGTWFDLLWTVPLLSMAVWVAHWNPEPGPRQATRGRQRTFSEMLLTNTTFALAPLIVLLQVSQLGVGWRFVRFFLLGVSILCFAARLALSESRGSKNEENVRRHTQAMDSSVDGMAILDARGIYTYVNSAYARMMGEASPESIVGKKWEEITAPEDAARLAPEIRQVLVEKGKWFGPVTIRRREGGTFSMEMAVTLLPDYGTVCVSRDVTERRAAEKALIEAEAKYRTLIEEVAAISYIAELGAKGQWLYVSPQVEQILGYSPDEWLCDSREWMRHIPAEDHAIVLAAEENSKRGERFQAEYRLTRKDRKVIWVSDTAVVVAGSDRHPVMEGIMVDITDRKILENQLQQSRKMEAVGRLAGGIAHDFNNLLTIINGYTELALQRSEKLPELHTHVERIGDASERAARLVRQLLAFSRRQVLQPKVLDLNGIVLGLDKLLRRLMDDNVEMSTVVREKIGAVKADPSQIEQVVMNLVVNARDAMPQGGRLTIETGEVDLDDAYARDHSSVAPGRYVMLAVSDTGMGMDSETQAHIFEPFYTTKSGGKGSGLGLSTVYGIVKQSGGYIWVYSEPGKGTTFKVYLPRVSEAAEPLVKGRAPLPEMDGTETILLVEDEPDVRELTKTILTARGYAVIDAPNPEQAKKLAQTFGREIHLLLTDVVMPGMSGRELAKHVTQNHPKMRVLYMSGYTFNVIAHGGQLEEGLAFLQKPFTPATLVQKVREVLDGSFPGK